MRFLFAFALPCALLCAEGIKSGVDRTALDPACPPCQDFWRYANGGWLDKNPIPARFPNWGTFTVLDEANRERMKVILENASTSTAAPGSDERKIGDLYASCMDTASIDALGAKPLDGFFARVDRIQSVQDLAKALAGFQVDAFVGPLVLAGSPDMKNSKDYIAAVAAGGLSLPEREYYFKDDERTAKIRTEFAAHVDRMMRLLGESPGQAAQSAKTVLSFETALAQATLTNVQRRDPYARYHKMDLAAAKELAPLIDWKGMLAMFNLPESTPINVMEPEFVKTVEKQLSAVPLDDWKTWLRWRLVNQAAPLLSKPFEEENFRFRGTVLTGTTEQQPRWRRCVNAVDTQMGDALGRLFVEKHFPPAARQRMDQLVENLRATLRDQLENADWLAPETRKNAVAKLNTFSPKIGYPQRWRDYSKVAINRKSYFANFINAGVNNRRYQMAKIGKPIDRNDWGMTPPTVNAYYNPMFNEIAFPAGILQPPFFDMSADDAANYGAIGAVIGHEMGHGFDDQGSKFDAQGNLKNWWTPEDRKKFEEKAGCVIDQFNTLDVGDGLHHNGKLVVGEAMGDLGGLTLAYKAYHRSLNGKPGPVIDGFTADQRFFLAFAHVWARQHRPEDLRLRLNTDPHPIAQFRADGTLQNMPEFQKAFNCKQGDPMVRPPEKRCKLW